MPLLVSVPVFSLYLSTVIFFYIENAICFVHQNDWFVFRCVVQVVEVRALQKRMVDPFDLITRKTVILSLALQYKVHLVLFVFGVPLSTNILAPFILSSFLFNKLINSFLLVFVFASQQCYYYFLFQVLFCSMTKRNYNFSKDYYGTKNTFFLT